jgi:hypothetical protein
MGNELVKQTLLGIARAEHRTIGASAQNRLFASEIKARSLERAAVANEAVAVENGEYLFLKNCINSSDRWPHISRSLKGIRDWRREDCEPGNYPYSGNDPRS